MQISDKGLALTKSFEGLRLRAYQDSAGVWTIGYGHTGPDVHECQVITEPQAEALLRSDMAATEQYVSEAVTVPLNQNQFDALCDFVFNVGIGNFHHSSLLITLNKGEYDAVPAEIMQWVRAGGKIIDGLIRRRQAEATLFKEPHN
ncbi:lysozyme [Granulicella cerasi]|uniref:Lysozyme n=1 Tax=Granulicella cerasi TaxID=741063 RepID=A0ABW1Z3J2_9BACT|nr:lysozyme [Granulicella cerasi]